MTAFATQSTSHGAAEIKWEIRSVNSRYLEPHFRLPDSYRDLEPALRELLRQHLSRGKIEITLKTQEDLSSNQFCVDNALVESLLSSVEQIEAHMQASTTVSPIDLLRWPGVLKQQATSNLTDSELLDSFQHTLAALCEGRKREGAKLVGIIEQRLESITSILSNLRQELPLIIERQQTLLKERIQRLITEVDPLRLEQEAVLLIQKADVEEELDRLDVHVGEVRHILTNAEPIGRRLDFLMQELNREANTLSSKSIALFSTQAAIDLKVLIEQMREQIQNIE